MRGTQHKGEGRNLVRYIIGTASGLIAFFVVVGLFVWMIKEPKPPRQYLARDEAYDLLRKAHSLIVDLGQDTGIEYLTVSHLEEQRQWLELYRKNREKIKP